MTRSGARRLWLLAPAACVLMAAAPAPELPDTLVTMIREAHPKERKTITNVAKRLYPASIAAINAVVAQIEKEERSAVAGTRFVQGWRGEATLGGVLTTGNTEEWALTASLEARRKGPRWSHDADV